MWMETRLDKMFAMKKRREYFPNGLDYNLNDPVLLSQISMTSGKHTIVRAKKRRPSIQNLEEVTFHGGELNKEERAFILEEVRTGIMKLGGIEHFGELAGWIKDMLDRRFGPEWQCIVGKKDTFGSCLSPMAGYYLNFSIGDVGMILFKS